MGSAGDESRVDTIGPVQPPAQHAVHFGQVDPSHQNSKVNRQQTPWVNMAYSPEPRGVDFAPSTDFNGNARVARLQTPWAKPDAPPVTPSHLGISLQNSQLGGLEATNDSQASFLQSLGPN